MKIPKPGTIPDSIGKLLFEMGAQTTEQIVVGLAPRKYVYHSIHNALSLMQQFGQITLSEDGYALSRELHKYYNYNEPEVECSGELTTQRYTPPFKAWSGKFSFVNVPRRVEIRGDVSFKTIGSGGRVMDAPAIGLLLVSQIGIAVACCRFFNSVEPGIERRTFTEEDFTDWYPSDCKPARQGTYDTRYPAWMSKAHCVPTQWTGDKWRFDDGSEAFDQGVEWRGLKEGVL